MGITRDRRQWRDADSLAAIGELTARWLEGTLAYQPEDFATQPAPETRPLVPVLAALNRAGYVTTNSQPGVALRAGSGQRAFVTGYRDEFPQRRDGEMRRWLVHPASADRICWTWNRDFSHLGLATLLLARNPLSPIPATDPFSEIREKFNSDGKSFASTISTRCAGNSRTWTTRRYRP